MPEIKLGRKWDCRSCGAKFYDFGKTDPACPKCGTVAGESESVPESRPRPRIVDDEPDSPDDAAHDDDVDLDDEDEDEDDEIVGEDEEE